jgi:predicted DsbA family dithiol-disulfide isomerase
VPIRGYGERLATKYGTSVEPAQEVLDSMTAAAAAEGLDFNFDRVVQANTFEAHQVIHAAAAHGLQDAVKERLLRAYFTEGEAVGDREVLVRLAAQAGMDAEVEGKALANQTHVAAVRAEEAEAAALGIRACRSSSSTGSTAFPAPSRLTTCSRCCGPRGRRAIR